MAAPSIHVRKRPFQPSITSYLNRGDTTHREHSSPSPLSPPLPADTQASLLSVGMRVRKSVPEGYKTHKTMGIEAFPFPGSMPPPASTAPVRPTPGFVGVGGKRELVPFCGLHKTGGLAAQDSGWVPTSSAPPVFQTHDRGYGDVPALSWSQSTPASTQNSILPSAPSAEGGGKKRSYEEETEDNLDAFFVDVAAAETQPTTRLTAKPKASLRRGAKEHAFGAGDFDDATFLAPMDMDEA
ncbi:hypothetical protein LTR08_006442 [Meristemomyces frigidus]|nr:hypothetical protein LTR08_006442 [Meristemomyces frigidus]